MDFDYLKKTALKYEARVDGKDYSTKIPPYYYLSLKDAFQGYFNTFQKIKSYYDYYPTGRFFSEKNLHPLRYTDEKNTVITLVGFERFFELFLKDLLQEIDDNLIYQLEKKTSIKKILTQIKNKEFKPKYIENKPLTINFRETIKRFFGLIELSKKKDKLLDTFDFKKVTNQYPFFETDNTIITTMRMLNWYRDRILHNGNKLPTLWYLDYLITKMVVPLIVKVIENDSHRLGNWTHFFITKTKINLLENLQEINFDLSDLENKKKKKQVRYTLFKLGHLKELGRANLNVLLDQKNNATLSSPPLNQGVLFANVLKTSGYNPNIKQISSCFCCGEKSMVVYHDEMYLGAKLELNIHGKCYNCDYELTDTIKNPKDFGII